MDSLVHQHPAPARFPPKRRVGGDGPLIHASFVAAKLNLPAQITGPQHRPGRRQRGKKPPRQTDHQDQTQALGHPGQFRHILHTCGQRLLTQDMTPIGERGLDMGAMQAGRRGDEGGLRAGGPERRGCVLKANRLREYALETGHPLLRAVHQSCHAHRALARQTTQRRNVQFINDRAATNDGQL